MKHAMYISCYFISNYDIGNVNFIFKCDCHTNDVLKMQQVFTPPAQVSRGYVSDLGVSIICVC